MKDTLRSFKKYLELPAGRVKQISQICFTISIVGGPLSLYIKPEVSPSFIFPLIIAALYAANMET